LQRSVAAEVAKDGGGRQMEESWGEG